MISFQEFPDGGAWTLDTFTETYLEKLKSYPFSLSLISFCYLVLIGIINEACFSWFPYICVTVANQIFGLKSIAAYRSGLEIYTNATRKDVEEGLSEILSGECST